MRLPEMGAVYAIVYQHRDFRYVCDHVCPAGVMGRQLRRVLRCAWWRAFEPALAEESGLSDPPPGSDGKARPGPARSG